MGSKIGDPAAWVTGVIGDFLRSAENSLENRENDRAWAEPLVGFSRGDDPLYEAYKEHVGPFHFTPAELFGQTFPERDFTAGELVVISWVLPQTEKTKGAERLESRYASEPWVRARIYGEQVNERLRRHVVEALTRASVDALAPVLSPLWSRKDSERFVFASNWSERHAAHAGGLGTFGLCDGLITPLGKAMRLGSVIARLAIPATPRPYSHHREYCLFYHGGKCRACVRRCPAGALSEAGHDKRRCKEYMNLAKPVLAARYGFPGYGCGSCQTGVPCESGIPARDGD